jgi:hypothetical protein
MGGWRELHYEELRDLYSSPSIIGMTKYGWLWLVIFMVKRVMHIGYCGKVRRKKSLVK